MSLFVFNRSGRKPLGFLSLICKKSSSESAEDTKGNKGKIQKPRIVTPKRNLKKTTPSSKGDRESCSLPSTSTSSSTECKNVAADAAVTVRIYFWGFLHFWDVNKYELVVPGVDGGHIVFWFWKGYLLQWINPDLYMSRKLIWEFSGFFALHLYLLVSYFQ